MSIILAIIFGIIGAIVAMALGNTVRLEATHIKYLAVVFMVLGIVLGLILGHKPTRKINPKKK